MSAPVVAEHYNNRPACDLRDRRTSPIFYLRNFNNWVKSMLIQDASDRNEHKGIRAALDLCCGKGGDLFKWKAANIDRLVCADIAEASIDECERKYRSLRQRHANLFRAVFVTADCTRERIASRPHAAFPVDVTSCQFALHYSFESLSRAEGLLRNASETLRPGGHFVGTLPDAFRIIQRLKAEGGAFGNSLFKIEPEFDFKTDIPLFGAKYNFHLEGVVDCPEFLVYFPVLEELAKKFDLELVLRMNFEDYFREKKTEGSELLMKMESLETVNRRDTETGAKCATYEHAVKHFESSDESKLVGTMSKEEWEIVSMYCIFIFQKKPAVDKNPEVD